MKSFKLLFSVLFISVGQLYAIAPNYSTNGNGKGNSGNGSELIPVAGCSRAVAEAVLNLNNVSALLHGTAGRLWQNEATGTAAYEVPKGSGRRAIFAGALWMGGLDVNGQLKIAATRFGTNGDDFWAGPLNTSTAEIDAAECAKWDKYFGVKAADAKLHRDYHRCKIDPNCDINATPEFQTYQTPAYFYNWPAHGDVSLGQDYYLAPFYDFNGDGDYNPDDGDYPYYDFDGEIDCRRTRDIRLFGDTTIWWVFNDKGNTHTESNGPSIGMEVRAQAFAFATNDEINNMTFYNYELINRSSFTLTETYFCQYVDADLGNYLDDFVGCDVQRGLGYCYNGDNDDENNSGAFGYGAQPPAIGVDFFEGPYQDNDGMDNPLTSNVAIAIADKGIPYDGLGLGYGDSIVDNERYGMRTFMYYNNAGGVNGDPQTALDHYNYMKGIWRDNSHMVFGGTGHNSSPGATTVLTNYMFPFDSDPLNWATLGIPQPFLWSEEDYDGAGNSNTPNDRRFLQSAGPFTLLPGAVNDITVGVVYARALSGGPFASVQELRTADDKAQALFDNCFKVLNGPNAPVLTFQELENEVIGFLDNPFASNNYREEYSELDPVIFKYLKSIDTLDGVPLDDNLRTELATYKFQGYQVYQLKSADVSVSDIYNVDKARLVFQCDVKDGVSQIVNYTFDKNLNANIPQEMVNGADNGITHSFRITTDQFASGEDNKLVNHKTYYYLAIAYGYNNYKKYDQLDPLALDGQKVPYLPSRQSALGSGISKVAVIPHNPTPENNGTYAVAKYGDEPQITRIEGIGNSGIFLNMTSSSEASALSSGFVQKPVYEQGNGPISVKVIDPLNVIGGTFTVKMVDTTTAGDLTDAYYQLIDPTGKVINSDYTIETYNEQLFLDYGFSVSIGQVDPVASANTLETGSGFVGATITFADSSKPWLSGLSDAEGTFDQNWIRSGTATYTGDDAKYNDYLGLDPEGDWEKLNEGTWAPYRMVSKVDLSSVIVRDAPGYGGSTGSVAQNLNKLDRLHSVDIVFTPDKSKWSRCVVFETTNDPVLAEGGANHLDLRQSPGVDQNGNPDGSANGWGWFPGYAIDLETGKRLNICFGESSWLPNDNGRDMKFNPTSTMYTGLGTEAVWGGKHYVYVFREDDPAEPLTLMPAYDGCQTIYNAYASGSSLELRKVWKSCMWVGIPMLEEGEQLLATEARVSLRVATPYESFTTDNSNGGLPMYQFDMTDLATQFSSELTGDSILDMINVVPNPYYAYSEYETSQLDNRIKIVNLPEECTVSIFNMNGTLVRQFTKSDPSTSVDWDLTNTKRIPVSGGVYLIHVEVPGIGERTLKWFGILRPTDLNSF
ncbi:MAG: hypothetical protein Kow0079_03030 [Vicingaceae bacterium]